MSGKNESQMNFWLLADANLFLSSYLTNAPKCHLWHYTVHSMALKKSKNDTEFLDITSTEGAKAQASHSHEEK